MENKYLEYYFDSKIYTKEQIQESIENTIKEFPNKNTKVDIKLNEFGIYVVTFEFENKNTVFSKMSLELAKRLKNSKTKLRKLNKNILEYTKKSKQQKQEERIQKRFDKYSGKDIFYGQYKSTGIYRPY